MSWRRKPVEVWLVEIGEYDTIIGGVYLTADAAMRDYPEQPGQWRWVRSDRDEGYWTDDDRPWEWAPGFDPRWRPRSEFWCMTTSISIEGPTHGPPEPIQVPSGPDFPYMELSPKEIAA